MNIIINQQIDYVFECGCYLSNNKEIQQLGFTSLSPQFNFYIKAIQPKSQHQLDFVVVDANICNIIGNEYAKIQFQDVIRCLPIEQTNSPELFLLAKTPWMWTMSAVCFALSNLRSRSAMRWKDLTFELQNKTAFPSLCSPHNLTIFVSPFLTIPPFEHRSIVISMSVLMNSEPPPQNNWARGELQCQ